MSENLTATQLPAHILEQIVLLAYPAAAFETDAEGQLVIYTGQYGKPEEEAQA